MEQPGMALFPHHAWLGYWEHVRGGTKRITVCRRQLAFYVSYMDTGWARVRWVRRGRETCYEVGPGAVRISPADGEQHTLIAAHDPGNSFYTLVIPRAQIEALAASAGIACPVEWRHVLCPDDPVLRACMKRLSAPAPAGEADADGRRDEAARRLMLRIVEVNGGRPCWSADAGPFGGRVLEHLVAYVDAHLQSGPRLVDMAPLVGLSPSHFARKFRRSTGLSLQRFVAIRRIQASFARLRDDDVPLARLAVELGFASQSHFTRQFGELTGVTPAKYRKQFTSGS